MSSGIDLVSSRSEHARSIKQSEYLAAEQYLRHMEASRTQDRIADVNEFSRAAWDRVADMFSRPDFAVCKSFVMVGCGPWPVTLMSVADRCPDMSITGLDIDPEALDTARKVISASVFDRIGVAKSDGVAFSYVDSEIVYVANLVSPKTLVLDQIAATARIGTLVVLRDPTTAGKHLAESGIDSLGSCYVLEGVGLDSEVFHSRHVFLRLRHRQKNV